MQTQEHVTACDAASQIAFVMRRIRVTAQKQNPRACAGIRQFGTPQAYLVGAIAGVLELLLAGFAAFFAPFLAFVFLPSSSILPVLPAPGVGAMLGVEELWLGSSAFFLALVPFLAFADVPASSAFGAPPGFGCMLGFELDCAFAASALMSKAAAVNVSVLETMVFLPHGGSAREKCSRAASR